MERGDIAMCADGAVGVITKIKVDGDGNPVEWKGICVYPPQRAGSKWQSIKPRLIMGMDQFEALIALVG